jgi:hypothetical protein
MYVNDHSDQVCSGLLSAILLLGSGLLCRLAETGAPAITDHISSTAALQSAVNNAVGGDIFVFTDGACPNRALIINASGGALNHLNRTT